MRSGVRRYRVGIHGCTRHAMRRRRSPRFFPVSCMVLKGYRSDRSPTHFVGRLGCSQEKIVCLNEGFEPGAAWLAFLDRGGSGENPYHARLGDRRVNDTLLNPRLRVDPNQQILPPITRGDQSATEILMES